MGGERASGRRERTLGVGSGRPRVIYDRTFYRETRFPRRKTTARHSPPSPRPRVVLAGAFLYCPRPVAVVDCAREIYEPLEVRHTCTQWILVPKRQKLRPINNIYFVHIRNLPFVFLPCTRDHIYASLKC